MKAPTPSPIWQAFAQGLAPVAGRFAMSRVTRHCFPAGQGQILQGARNYSWYPSPSLRSGPSQAGPTLSGQASVDCASHIRNCFEFRDIAVESAAITTRTRGSHPCASRLSSSPFCPCRLPVACKIPRRAGWPVPLRALWSPMRWTRTSSQVPRWAAWPAPPPAGSSWACRPAARATERLTEQTARGRIGPGAARAICPGGPFAFRLGGTDV